MDEKQFLDLTFCFNLKLSNASTASKFRENIIVPIWNLKIVGILNGKRLNIKESVLECTNANAKVSNGNLKALLI